jgi:ATP-dependent Lon protease
MSDESEFIPRDTDEASSSNAKALVHPDSVLPDTLQIIPLKDRPYFPVLIQPLVVNQEPWGPGLKIVAESPHKLVGLCFAPDLREGKNAKLDLIRAVGCVARVHKIQAGDGKIQFIAQGLKRFRITSWVRQSPPLVARVEYLDPVEEEDETQIRAYGRSMINIIKELASLNPLYSEELKHYLNYFTPNEPSPLTDFAAAITSADPSELQGILETVPILDRMQRVLLLMSNELELARLQAKITQQVQDQVDTQQREFFLRQQLKAIQQELGIAKDDRESDADKFRERLEDLTVPEAVSSVITAELEKLQVLDPSSSEYGVTRNYLDWITSVPWGRVSTDQLDLSIARKILDADHDGLEDVKDRIVEFLGVGAYRGEIAGSILLLVGPPGVGKTSIGKSIARALGREFYRFSLGGMRDEAEIKGHRRTYVGAMPGKLIQALKDVKVQNPVIMLDEIDKIGASFQGDPASALLEVLDPEQNEAFLDHYLDVRVDLSKVLFVCTANQLDTIPGPLLDRMETIRLAGYLTEEKVAIAKHHLWPKQLGKAGLKKAQLKLSDAVLRRLIYGYAREAGVRVLDQLLGRLVRKAVVQFLEQGIDRLVIDQGLLTKWLGAPIFQKQVPQQGMGVVNGLAWTALGGTTLSIEATRVPGQGRGFKQTGQLGSVMQESAQIAYSYVAGAAGAFGIEPGFFDEAFIHLHVPEGATPKDGPSAGITMATALVSLATNRTMKKHIAMTGELTLTGRVLPVGGIREKVIAAKRAGIKTVLLPEANRRDFDEMPDYLKPGLSVHFVSQFDEVAALVF